MGKIETNGMDFAMHSGKKKNKTKGAETQNVQVKSTSFRELWGGSEKV